MGGYVYGCLKLGEKLSMVCVGEGASTEDPSTLDAVFEVIAVDFTTLEPATDERENVLVVKDLFTKFSQAFATRDQKEETTAKILLKEWFLKYGVPQSLHSDQGRNFKSAVIAELCRFYGVNTTHTTPHHLKETLNVRGSTKHCMTSYEPSQQRRNADSQST